MVTVLRSGGFSVVIFTDDHPPAHVHVARQGGRDRRTIKIDLRTMKLLKNEGFSASDARKAFELVAENRTSLLNEWRRIHG